MFDHLIYDELKIVKGVVNKPFECVKEIIINEYIILDYTCFKFYVSEKYTEPVGQLSNWFW